MSESALGVRQKRAAETSDGLRDAARRLTAVRGLNGFTIEELCDAVGVSRRTFFNYFASKENAVLGFSIRADMHQLDERFVTRTGSLVEDYVSLHAERWAVMGHSQQEADALGQLLDSEPRLFRQLMTLMTDAELTDIALIMRRRDAPTDPEVAEVLVRVMNPLIRATVAEFFASDAADFHALLLRRVDAARTALTR